MVDIRMLTYLSKPVTILEHTYRVAWNSLTNEAEVVKNKEETIASFPTELDAHRYIRDLGALDQTKDMEAWKRISEQETTT